MRATKILSNFILLLCLVLSSLSSLAITLDDVLLPLIKQHPDKTGIYVLEKGGESLLARAWLTDKAIQTIDVQYFIWSNDNIGKLASEALLRAADRGVKVRVLVDDLLIDADNQDLYALAYHKNINIRIYNPTNSVGTSLIGGLFNFAFDFRDSNQRMHNKLFIVDKKIAITGGRNMANEYFDFGHRYNYRDRDVLLAGKVIQQAHQSFEQFWNSKYAVAVNKLVDNPYLSEVTSTYTDVWGDEQELHTDTINTELDAISEKKVQLVYNFLHDYADNEENILPEVRDALSNLENEFDTIISNTLWVDARFISDDPGKNVTRPAFSLGGGGKITTELAELIKSAKHSVLIQSPYLVLSSKAMTLFDATIKRNVSIRINTNSLASTDNLPAFSGYSSQIKKLLKTGIDVYEYRPDAKRRSELVKRYSQYKDKLPIFSLHAKTMVIDNETVYIGTFNLDPRSENLNTEVGIVIKDKRLAAAISKEIELDMNKENSWDVRTDGHNKNSPFYKRSKLFFWKLIPMKSIL